MNDNTVREKSYYELLVDAMKREYPIHVFEHGSEFANIEEAGRKEFALMQETIAAQARKSAELQEALGVIANYGNYATDGDLTSEFDGLHVSEYAARALKGGA